MRLAVALFITPFLFGSSCLQQSGNPQLVQGKQCISQSPQVWPNGYKYCTTAQIASGQITGTLTNFPALISLSSPTLATVANGGTVQHTVSQSGGAAITIPADFLVTSDSCAVGTASISGVEFESYSASGGTALVWVNVASAATGSSVYIFWGNSSQTMQLGTVSNTWNSNYKGVFHFASTPGLTTIDSTSNGNNASTAASPTAQAGEVDGAIGFNGTTQYAYSNNGVTTGNLTLSGWLYETMESGSTVPTVLDQGETNATDSGFQILTLGNGFGNTTLLAGLTFDTFASVTTPNQIDNWIYFAATYTASTKGTSLSVNGGTPGTSTAAGTFSGGSGYLSVGGSQYSATGSYYGYVDELRLATVALSSAWTNAEYNDESAPNTFWTLTYNQQQ
jgi:biopolymer transport protein ExbB